MWEVDHYILLGLHFPFELSFGMSLEQMARLNQRLIKLGIAWHHLPNHRSVALEARNRYTQGPIFGLHVLSEATEVLAGGVLRDGSVVEAVVEDVRSKQVTGGDVWVLDEVQHDLEEAFGVERAWSL